MNHLETQEKIKFYFENIENKFPVDEWKINGIHVWPYIRIKLYFTLLTSGKDKDSKQKTQQNSSNNGISKLINKATKIFKVIGAFVSLKLFFLNLKNKQILFFGAHFHRVLQKGNYFNRFYDSIVDHHNLHNEVYMVEYQKVYSNSFNQKAIIALTKQLNNYKLLGKFKPNAKIDDSSVSLKDYNTFCNYIEGIGIDPKSLGVNSSDLISWVTKMINLQGFFIRFYKKVKPKNIVFLGYYGYDDLYAALITANKMGITTVDFQHGPQSNVHMAFSNWLKVPQEGFNTMPTDFWNWDENSKNNIDKWATKIKAISVKVVGQPYIGYCKKFLESSSLNEKAVLYSLQTAPIELLTPKVIKLIQNSNYKWVLRLHPRSNTSIKDIEDYLIENKINNKTVIENPLETPLPETISKSILHITNYSGCAIESKIMGVPTLLIHKVGKEMFGDYIDNKLVYFINQDEAIFNEKVELLIKKIEDLNFDSETVEIFNPLV